jgi:hypothetical protein
LRNLSSILVLFAALLISSCTPEQSIDEQRAGYVALDVFLKSGQSIDNIHVRSLTHQGSSYGVSDLDVYLRSEENTYKLSENAAQPGHYFYDDRFELVEEGVEYKLSLYHDGEVVSATTTAPPMISNLSLSTEVLDSEIDGELLSVDWKGINQGSFAEYFYIIKITPLSEEEFLVPLDDKCLSCPKAVGDVILNSDATLTIDDFNYYGDHLIEVFAISNENKDLFVSQTDLAENGLSNVQNGTGFFVGVSVLSDYINIK